MDDRRTSISSRYVFGRDGADKAPIAPRVRHPTDVEHKPVGAPLEPVEQLPPDPLREGSAVVYCGNAQQISEGFVIALRAMGVEPGILRLHDGLSTINPTKEEN